MKALSLLQPWASLVVMGRKTVETRSWTTAHRGPLLIHASGGKAGALPAAEAPLRLLIPPFNELPFGALLGIVQLVDVVRAEDLPPAGRGLATLTLEENAFGDEKRRWAWILADAVAFARPMPMKGTLGLWTYNGPLPDVAE